MKLDQMRLMLELQALKGLTNSSSTTGTTSTTALFQQLFSTLLTGQVESTENYAGLGSTVPVSTTTSLPATVNTVSIPPIQLTKLSSTGAPTDFEDIINKAAETYDIPAKLIKSVIKVESNFNPNAVSPAGASGLMQLMPATAKGLGVTNVFNPEDNIMGGAKYIKQMLDRYDGNIKLALAAYNAGPGNVAKYGGVPPFTETVNYVRKVTDAYMA